MISHQHHPYASQFHKSMHRKDATSVQNWLNYWIAHVNCWSLKSGYWTVFFDILIINAVQTYRKSLLLQESLETAAHSAVAWLQLHISIDWGRWTHSALPSDERQIAKKCKKIYKNIRFQDAGICTDLYGFGAIMCNLLCGCKACSSRAAWTPGSMGQEITASLNYLNFVRRLCGLPKARKVKCALRHWTNVKPFNHT